MTENSTNLISAQELNKQFNWFQSEYSGVIESAFNDFFGENFELKLLGLSKNVNWLSDEEGCFVSNGQFAPEYEVYFRLTESAVNILLDTTLGESSKKFHINNISELETKIMSSFNGIVFGLLKDKVNKPNPKELQRTNLDVIHMTFVLRNKIKEDKRAGKFIISLPQALLAPKEINTDNQGIYTEDDFPDSATNVKVYVGSTRFSLYDLKNIETDDVVVFENSDIEKLQIINGDERTDILINPNLSILMPEQEQDGGSAMDSTNLWDSIQVDMNGEFDAVKITLADLKNIQNGMVMDLASLYENKVTLKVEGRPVASGSLVIVNDRYGVKIEEVISQDGTSVQSSGSESNEQDNAQEIYDENDVPEETSQDYEENEEPSPDESFEEGEEGEEGEEEFDYSDFELEDENI